MTAHEPLDGLLQRAVAMAERIVAVLRDVVEDGDVTLARLAAA